METEKDNRPDAKDKDWTYMQPYWSQVNAIVRGRDALIEHGETYLPKFPHETREDYDFRLATAKFTNVYRDILEGLASKPFAQEMTLTEETSDEAGEAFIKDVDGCGNHLHVFAGEVFFSGINNAIDWILVDYSRNPGARTVEEESQAGVRPYWVHVPADRVIWIDSEIIQGREQLTKVKILEEKGRVRTFMRDGNNVTWMVETEGEGGWAVEDEGKITLGEIPMVPFITGRRMGKHWKFHPPMRDAADLQIELYQQETALKHIRTMTCFPMLAGNGVQPDIDPGGKAKKVPVGPNAVLFAPPDHEGRHGSWEWIGTDATTLRFLSEDIDKTIKELRELGRQPLTAQSGNLTVITTAVAAAKGNSAVQAWALQLKDALDQALRLTAAWMNTDKRYEVRVFTDFGVDDLNQAAADQLLKAREMGDISQITLWEEFKRRGILSPEFDADREIMERLFQELPGDDMSGPDGPENFGRSENDAIENGRG